MFEGIRKGFRRPKKLNRKQQERQDNIKSFIDRYKTLCEDEGYQFDAMLEVTPQGILPKMTIIEHRPKPDFETKPWEECKKENEETKKRLKEEAREEDQGGTNETIKD